MPILTLDDFRQALPKNRSLLGLDPGTKTIGVASSDVRRTIATPVVTINRTKLAADLGALAALAADRETAGIVLGYPVEMDGTLGPRAQATRAFARAVLERLDLPLLLWDERLSTSAVERTLIGEADLSRKKRKGVIDRAAAAYILQGALDALGPTGG